MRITRYIRQHHIGLIAIFVALTGTAYAGTQVASHQPGPQVLKAKKKKKKKTRPIPGPAGPQGPQGLTGPPGPATGPAVGGSLTGSYPNPGIAANAVGPNQIAERQAGHRAWRSSRLFTAEDTANQLRCDRRHRRQGRTPPRSPPMLRSSGTVRPLRG